MYHRCEICWKTGWDIFLHWESLWPGVSVKLSYSFQVHFLPFFTVCQIPILKIHLLFMNSLFSLTPCFVWLNWSEDTSKLPNTKVSSFNITDNVVKAGPLQCHAVGGAGSQEWAAIALTDLSENPGYKWRVWSVIPICGNCTTTADCSPARVEARNTIQHRNICNSADICTSRIEISAANRLIGEVVQSRRRPLLGPSPGWKCLLALSHSRHY